MAIDETRAPVRHQRGLFFFARLEAHGRARGDIETHAISLLAVELAVSLTARNNGDATLTHILALVFFLVSVFFVWRSFHSMRIGTTAMEPRAAEREVVKSAAGD